MKIKVHLEHDETIEDADDFLEKAVAAKKDVGYHERYTDEFLNDFHEYLLTKHHQFVQSIIQSIKEEIEHDANKKGSVH